MSRGRIALLAIVGGLTGAYVGMPFLSDGAQCQGISEGAVQCHLNQVHLPFLSAVTLGMAAAIAFGMVVRHLVRYGFRPAPERRQTDRAAVEVDDTYLQLASWGLAPRSAARMTPRRLEAAAPGAPASRGDVEDGDPYLQLATWGLAPHSSRRVMPRGIEAEAPPPVHAGHGSERRRRRRSGINGRGRPVPTPPRGVS
jgi:hypothetical protein